ncbi:MAG: N-acetylmuramoyl-L-alanine amidase [Treponema sp.]|jgi:N-acetylmuramoyl-L-alanine amidase|nr:N-acetylmuramoyl-L-alanine amidase [Treponema sp.]
MRKRLILIYAVFVVNLQAEPLLLENALKKMGYAPEFQWEPFLQTGVIYDRGHFVSFYTGEKDEPGVFLVDGYYIVEAPLPYMEKGVIRFPEAFVTSVEKAISDEVKNDIGLFRVAAIIIDPGHGGKDTGAIGTPIIDGKKTIIQEKDVALTVSKDLYAMLVKAFPNKQVLMTRNDDSTISLEKRVSFANAVNLAQNEAIIFVAVHCNAAPYKANARGYEVWYLPPDVRRSLINKSTFDGPAEVIPILNSMKEEEFTIESRLLASAILKRFDEVIGKSSPSRGIKEEEWYVVKKANMPSVLVELGFITNASDAKLLTDSAYVKNFSNALFKGISDFIATYEQPGGFSVLLE